MHGQQCVEIPQRNNMDVLAQAGGVRLIKDLDQ